MQRILIIATNCALLVLLLIGLPAVAHLRLGDWQISSVSTSRQLLFWGLAIAAAGNILTAHAFVTGRKGKVLCWEWAVIYGGLLLAAYGYQHGYFNFNWLEQTLLWWQQHF